MPSLPSAALLLLALAGVAGADTAVKPRARCAPWQGASSLEASSQAGNAAFFRRLRYDFTSGVVEVHDSDLYAPAGKTELSSPRVLKEKKALAADERARLEAALVAICPTPKDLEQRCAPGGCMRLVVKHSGGADTVVENVDRVGAVMRLLEKYFPTLRK